LARKVGKGGDEGAEPTVGKRGKVRRAMYPGGGRGLCRVRIEEKYTASGKESDLQETMRMREG